MSKSILIHNTHYSDVIMGAIAIVSQKPAWRLSTQPFIQTQIKENIKAPLTGLCAGIHRWPVNSPHKWPITRKMFQIDDVFMSFDMTVGCVASQPENTLIILINQLAWIITWKFSKHANLIDISRRILRPLPWHVKNSDEIGSLKSKLEKNVPQK